MVYVFLHCFFLCSDATAAVGVIAAPVLMLFVAEKKEPEEIISYILWIRT